MHRATEFLCLDDLRQALRQQRRGLSSEQQRSNSLSICQRAATLISGDNAQHIGAYIAFDGEPDIAEIQYPKSTQVWYPVVSSSENDMHFAKGEGTTNNRFGIKEPISAAEISILRLSTIFVPLVGYDKDCNRIGMGKGFYDKALSQVATETQLIGIAHSCQEVDKLNPQPWDIPLDAIVTERGILYRPDTLAKG